MVRVYRSTGFNWKNLIIANCEFYRVRKLLIRKLILLLAHPYVQFAQTQLLNSQCKLKRDDTIIKLHN